MRVLLAGMLAADPRQGGATWAVLQYADGLRRLGHDVAIVDPVRALSPGSVDYFEELALESAALLVEKTRESVGWGYDDLRDFDAEVLINLSGLLRDRELTGPIPTRVFVDLDPVFVQIWHAQGHDFGFDEHTHHASVGSLLAKTGIPLDRPWMPTLPPVVLERWPVAQTLEHDAFTTVGHWRSYGSVEWNGTHYGQKAHAVRRLFDLPSATRERLLPALAVDPAESADLEALAAHGWQLADPAVVAGTPDRYRAFVAGSKGELGLAKAGYLDARCGWFSDRSACYLASGRPVVAHDTGLSTLIPTGEGLVVFGTTAEAAAGLDRVGSDYEHHRVAARALAEEYLDSDRVLTRLLEGVL